MHVVIVGGSDAGISAALRGQELAPETEITVLLADAFPNYSICGLPFYLSGETPDYKALAHRTEFPGIRVLSNHTVSAIDASNQTLTASNEQSQNKRISYDKLVIATGAKPLRPKMPGTNSRGVFPLHTMADSFRFQQFLSEREVRSAVIVGAGYIGLEMADALVRRGLEVTLVGRGAAVLSTVDTELGQTIEAELLRHHVAVFDHTEVQEIRPDGHWLQVFGTNRFQKRAELVLLALGIEPVTDLAADAGATHGPHHAIAVDHQMRTNLPNVFAAGDCVETWHRQIGWTYLPLGTTAHKQGRVAGENAVGGDRIFAGSVGTQVVKVFDLAIARTGLKDEEARTAGFVPLTVSSRHWDHKAYYPGAQELQLRVTGDQRNGKLLGAQCVGSWQSEVAKRIDVFATALFHDMTVDGLNDLDLSYSPPFSSPWDPIQMSAQAWSIAQATERKRERK